jgi:hypothetical protein
VTWPATPPTRLLANYQAELTQTRIGWVNNTGPTEENSYIRMTRSLASAGYTASRWRLGSRSTVLIPGVWSAWVNSTNSASLSMWALWPGRM